MMVVKNFLFFTGDQGEMLLHALHGGAAPRAEQSVQVIVAALNSALEYGART